VVGLVGGEGDEAGVEMRDEEAARHGGKDTGVGRRRKIRAGSG
jgi:hypothetical protein